jgi:hypothetical protein
VQFLVTYGRFVDLSFTRMIAPLREFSIPSQPVRRCMATTSKPSSCLRHGAPVVLRARAGLRLPVPHQLGSDEGHAGAPGHLGARPAIPLWRHFLSDTFTISRLMT